MHMLHRQFQREKKEIDGIFLSLFPFFLPFFLAIVVPFLRMCKVTVLYDHTETNKGDRLILFRHAETNVSLKCSTNHKKLAPLVFTSKKVTTRKNIASDASEVPPPHYNVL